MLIFSRGLRFMVMQKVALMQFQNHRPMRVDLNASAYANEPLIKRLYLLDDARCLRSRLGAALSRRFASTKLPTVTAEVLIRYQRIRTKVF